MLNVSKTDKNRIKISYKLSGSHRHRFDFFFCVPANPCDIEKGRIDEKKWLNKGVFSSRSYYGAQLNLNRVASYLEQELNEYSLNKNSSYKELSQLVLQQFEQALDKQIAEIITTQRLYLIDQLAYDLNRIQRLLREGLPTSIVDQNYYFYLDNAISWLIYQELVQLLVKLRGMGRKPSHPAYQTISQLLDKQRTYRDQSGYDLPHNARQLGKLTWRLSWLKNQLNIEEGIVERVDALGYYSHQAIVGVSAAVAMLGVYSLLFYTQDGARQITLPLLASIAIAYGLRDIFKEGLRNRLQKLLKLHHFQWQRLLINGLNRKLMVRQRFALRWCGFSRLNKYCNIPVDNRNFQVLHYSCTSNIKKKNIPTGFDGVQESLTLDFSMFAKKLLSDFDATYLLKSSGRISEEIPAHFTGYLLVIVQGNKEEKRLLELTIMPDRIIRIRNKDSLIFKESDSTEQNPSQARDTVIKPHSSGSTKVGYLSKASAALS